MTVKQHGPEPPRRAFVLPALATLLQHLDRWAPRSGDGAQWCIDHDLRPSVALRSGDGANVGETAGVSDEVAPRSGGSSLHKRRNGDRHGAGPTQRNGA